MSNDERNDPKQTTIPNLGKPPRPTWSGGLPTPNFDDPASIEPFRAKRQAGLLGGVLGGMLGPGVAEKLEMGGAMVAEWAGNVLAELRGIRTELKAVRAELLHDREQRLADAAALAEAFAKTEKETP